MNPSCHQSAGISSYPSMSVENQSHALVSCAYAFSVLCPQILVLDYGIISISLLPLTSSKLRPLLITLHYIIVLVIYFVFSTPDLSLNSVLSISPTSCPDTHTHTNGLPSDGIIRLKFLFVLLLLCKIWSPAYQTSLASCHLLHVHCSLKVLCSYPFTRW